MRDQLYTRVQYSIAITVYSPEVFGPCSYFAHAYHLSELLQLLRSMCAVARTHTCVVSQTFSYVHTRTLKTQRTHLPHLEAKNEDPK